jgi:CubicO group peptidase (beta-lactamase class C family)
VRARPAPPPPPPVAAPTIDFDDLRANVLQRIQTGHLGDAAVVVAIVVGDRTLLVTSGKTGAHDPALPDGDTLFEIGSITKVYAGILLADETLRARVRLDQPVQELFPDVKLPERDGQKINFVELATHRSGLPVMPTNWVPVTEGEYTPEMLHAFLECYTLPFTPGTKVAYGNVGYAVLGDALARRESTTFRALLDERVLRPLGMKETSFVGDTPPGIRWAEGHEADFAVVPRRFDKPRMPACCAMQSTANDLLPLVHVALHPKDDPIGRAVRASLASQGQGDGSFDDVDMALGWVLEIPNGVAVKEGSMKGFSSAMAVDRAQDEGVVVLTALGDFHARSLAFGVLREVDRLREALKGPNDMRVKALPKDAQPTDVDFDGKVRLVGFRAPATVHRGERVDLDLFFRCDAKVDRDWRVFVHGDAKGAKHRLHADHYPKVGLDECKPGEIVRDAFPLEIPDDYDAKQFTLWIGMYDGSKRMPIVLGQGDGKDRAEVTTIAVAP